jgi:superfamily I DNA and/or RNA helicase
MLSFFSLVRNNPENKVGAAGTLQDVNVAISRSKERLIILGNFEMMLNSWTVAPTDFNMDTNVQRGIWHI